MNKEQMIKLEKELIDAALPIIQKTDDVVDGIVLLTMFAKYTLISICATEGFHVMKNLKAASNMFLLGNEHMSELEAMAHRKAIERSITEQNADIIMNAKRAEDEGDENKTVVRLTRLWGMRDAIGEVLKRADLDIPKEIIMTCIIGTLAQWTGKPVSFYNDSKENKKADKK